MRDRVVLSIAIAAMGCASAGSRYTGLCSHVDVLPEAGIECRSIPEASLYRDQLVRAIAPNLDSPQFSSVAQIRAEVDRDGSIRNVCVPADPESIVPWAVRHQLANTERSVSKLDRSPACLVGSWLDLTEELSAGGWKPSSSPATSATFDLGRGSH